MKAYLKCFVSCYAFLSFEALVSIGENDVRTFHFLIVCFYGFEGEGGYIALTEM